MGFSALERETISRLKGMGLDFSMYTPPILNIPSVLPEVRQFSLGDFLEVDDEGDEDEMIEYIP